MNRRRFLRTTGLAAGALTMPWSTARAAIAGGAPKRILILGGTGFLGPHIVNEAIRLGHSVAILNRGRREPSLFESAFERVEHLVGDRGTPEGYDALKGRKWDVVIETSGYRHPWTRDAVRALAGNATSYVYVSSTGVFWPYRTTEIAEDGPIPLVDDPPAAQPSYGVMKALSENEVRTGFPNGALIIRPGYIVGPGDTSDRWTYWPVRIARGGNVMVPGMKTDRVQYIDVRDLAAWMLQLIDNGTTGTFNAVGPAQLQTMEQFVTSVAGALGVSPRWTWIEDYEWLRKYPHVKNQNGTTEGLLEAVPWIMPLPTELGHMRIDGRKALRAGLRLRPLAETARDTLAWRNSDDVPAALKATPRYVLTPEQEAEMLRAWAAR